MANLILESDDLFDSHTHLTSRRFAAADIPKLVSSAQQAGVHQIIDIGIDLESSKQVIQHAQTYPGIIYAAVGIDPQVAVPGDKYFDRDYYQKEHTNTLMTSLYELSIENLDVIKMIGETGIDLYHNRDAIEKGSITKVESEESLTAQKYLFIKHLELAQQLELPLSVHSRGAEQLCIDIVKDFPGTRGIFHSFTGNYFEAKQIIDLGWGLGVNGIITFKNGGALRETYQKLLGKVSSDWSPGDFYKRGIYFETDAPYLAPEPHRGDLNKPQYTKIILDAFIHGMKM